VIFFFRIILIFQFVNNPFFELHEQNQLNQNQILILLQYLI